MSGFGTRETVTAPVNVDIPLASQDRSTLVCTMGNWDGEPTSYTYTWTVDGVSMEPQISPNYEAVAADVGKEVSCVVTATNDGGSTDSPASNSFEVAPYIAPEAPAPEEVVYNYYTSADGLTYKATEPQHPSHSRAMFPAANADDFLSKNATGESLTISPPGTTGILSSNILGAGGMVKVSGR